YTRCGEEPPNPAATPDWAEQIGAYSVRIALDTHALPDAAKADPHFWYVGFHDSNGLEIHRQDLSEAELKNMLADNSPLLVIERGSASKREPVSWTVWPVSHSQGWLPKLQGKVDRTPARATLVTALVDIGRGQLAGPFARSFEEHYVPVFERLLAADLPMVIYLDPKHADIVWRRRRPHNTKVVPLTPDMLRAFPHFDRVQEIRGRADWYSQTGWLPWSPQAALEYYNPLVMSKMRWLGDQARTN